MSVKTSRILNSNDKIAKFLDVTTFKKGDIETKVQSLDGIPIIRVPFALLFTEYTFKSGGASEPEGGFEKKPNAKAINWIVAARKAPIAISKTETIRIFEPQKNIKADAWKLDYRKYHDLWIPKNKLPGVFVNIN